MSNLPSYPSSPAASAPRTEVPRPPQFVTLAFWGYLLVALLEIVVTVISVIALAGSKSSISKELSKQTTASGQHVDVETVVAAGTVGVVVVGVIALALYLIFAILLRRGFGWARIVLLVVTVISLLGVTGEYGIAAVKVGIAIVATVFVFLAPSSAWFRATKQARIDRRYGR